MCVDDCREILSNCEAFDIAEDDIIIAQGESDSSLYIVLKGRVSVYCNPNQQGVRVTSVMEPPVSLPKSNANADVSSSLVVPNGGSDSGIGGVGPFFREDASNSGGNAGPSPECRIALLEPPSPASRRSSAYSNSSELIPPLSPTPSDSAYGSLLIPSASPSPSGSAQLKVPRVRKTSVFSGSFDSSLLNPPASTSRRESLQLEVPPIRKNSTCSCSGDSLFNPPTTISRSGSAQLEVPPGTSRRNSLSPRPGLLPSAIRRGRVADLLSPQINVSAIVLYLQYNDLILREQFYCFSVFSNIHHLNACLFKSFPHIH